MMKVLRFGARWERRMSESLRPRCEFDAENLRLQVRMKVPGEVSGVDEVVDNVVNMIERAKCAPGSGFDVRVALQEALVNAIVHGCGADPSKAAELCVACDEAGQVLIIVRDPGKGFDPGKIPSPVVGDNIYSSHGRGIFLINQLMDEVSFEKGGTEIVMRKH